MPIRNPVELDQAVREASALIQEISDFVKANPNHEARGRVRFPTGYFPTAAEHRRKLEFIADRTVRKNLSYAIMTHDVLRWLVTRTTLSIQAREMVIKEAICLIGSVCETISIWRGTEGLGRQRSYSDRMARLRHLEVIDEDTETDLNWVWDIRCREHIAGVSVQEWNHYNMDQWRRSVRAYKALRDGLAEWQRR